MRLHRIPATSIGLMLTLAACTDDTQADAADEIATESTTESESESTTESGPESTTESGTESTTESESESSSTDTGETTIDTGDTTDTEESTTEGSTTEGSTTESTTEESTTTDTGDLSCEEIPSAYAALVESNTGCDVDDDCHVVDGHCWMGLGGCWYVVNSNLKQADLDDLADAFQACPPPFICACIPPPANVGCVEGTCQAL